MSRTKVRKPNPLPDSFYSTIGAQEDSTQAVDIWSERAEEHKKLLIGFLGLPDGEGEPWVYQSCIIGTNLALNALAKRRTRLTFLEEDIL